jgi:hypothetical protein
VFLSLIPVPIVERNIRINHDLREQVTPEQVLHFGPNCGTLYLGKVYVTAEETVSAKITAAFPRLSRRQKQVARFAIDNEYCATFASAAEVGQKAGVSITTVVRFCQALGYEGYPHLQAAVR